jgi:hypothetical protein
MIEPIRMLATKDYDPFVENDLMMRSLVMKAAMQTK